MQHVHCQPITHLLTIQMTSLHSVLLCTSLTFLQHLLQPCVQTRPMAGKPTAVHPGWVALRNSAVRPLQQCKKHTPVQSINEIDSSGLLPPCVCLPLCESPLAAAPLTAAGVPPEAPPAPAPPPPPPLPLSGGGLKKLSMRRCFAEDNWFCA
mmetsp:Transcript_5384/g.14516  ORF Transcript_5384/g.14516 Transcript_5384/m.14516 type:complete len:152 (+) Transcript_5384:566-1021(+)